MEQSRKNLLKSKTRGPPEINVTDNRSRLTVFEGKYITNQN